MIIYQEVFDLIHILKCLISYKTNDFKLTAIRESDQLIVNSDRYTDLFKTAEIESIVLSITLSQRKLSHLARDAHLS